MRVDRLTEPGAILGEGPVWDPDHETLLWVDILGCKVNRTEPGTGVTQSIETPSAVGAVAIDRSGGLITSLVDGVYRHRGSDWARLVEIEGDRPENRSNESKCDPYGNYLVGTMLWTGDRATGSLYRIHPDLTVDTLRTGLTIANGMAWAGDTMWHIDTPTGQVVGFRYDPVGPLGETMGVIDVEPPGRPDGMCIDAEGGLWVAVWGSGTVQRYSPDGSKLDELTVPASQVSSCSFGGSDLSLLFITTASVDIDPSSEPDAGAVFVAEPGVVGLEPDRFDG
jgi:sugar lactone lactonase YvrE